MNNEKFIAFFDILGFCNLIKDFELDKILQRMKSWLKIINACCIEKKVDEVGREKIREIVKVKQFSDTVIFYTDGLSEEDFDNLIHVSRLFIYMSFFKGFPIRGVIVRGELFIENDICLGMGLVKGYEKEKFQEWAGAYVDEEVIDYMDNTYKDWRTTPLFIEYLMNYQVPFKNGVYKNLYALNWVNFIVYPEIYRLESFQQILAAFVSFELMNQFDYYKKLGKKPAKYQVLVENFPDNYKYKAINTVAFYTAALAYSLNHRMYTKITFNKE